MTTNKKETNQARQVYTIKQELHPLKVNSFVYRAYFKDGTPLYIGREKLGELIAYMYDMHPDWTYNIDELEAIK